MSAKIELVVEKTITKIAPFIREPLDKVPDLESGLNPDAGKYNDISLLSIKTDYDKINYIHEIKPIQCQIVPTYPLQNIIIEK